MSERSQSRLQAIAHCRARIEARLRAGAGQRGEPNTPEAVAVMKRRLKEYAREEAMIRAQQPLDEEG